MHCISQQDLCCTAPELQSRSQEHVHHHTYTERAHVTISTNICSRNSSKLSGDTARFQLTISRKAASMMLKSEAVTPPTSA
mmetsp:Transcript_26846/g.49008  ORF Transcript_26846/g.49008 Transcript_26846/m.49008 type:complete len:81 (+) Transcript_26846:25-267(+)